MKCREQASSSFGKLIKVKRLLQEPFCEQMMKKEDKLTKFSVLCWDSQDLVGSV
jgi:hypothetical protein